ncbi:helix-turn-helix domain-containing protein [Azoarcus indigens]|uniref:Helix-turn-helix protein n=1 Tax=Azoarcus indigens TaxID=29545 RepID=A0A4R6EFE0_9RHOO|nr:helix-turn-helix transcriptional regulator [Azoarcus indigens]NMG63453.1 helix-turn-helix domain-containing protein [Azoarcus indigens]TDN57005.1 helix-turn-helix protein [Azoarcus indigens]
MGSIGERLRSERLRLGMSQADFGSLAGVQKQAQLKYEKGERLPGAAYLAAVAGEGVDVLYVLTGRRAVEVAAGEPVIAVELLEACVEAVELEVANLPRQLSLATRARLIAVAYQLSLAEHKVEIELLRPLIKLAI